MLTAGSLFTGTGQLERALHLAGVEAELMFVADPDPGARTVLAHRLPGVPNLGNVAHIDWAAVARYLGDRLGVLCGGFPCQDVSCAGRRLGIADGTRSGLWAEFVRAIAALRPRVVLIENVRGLLSAKAHSDVELHSWCVGGRRRKRRQPALRALGAVLGDLSDLGYDAVWTTVAASDVGAAHKRERVFVLAYERGEDPAAVLGLAAAGTAGGRAGDGAVLRLLPTPTAADGERTSLEMVRGNPTLAGALLPTPRASDTGTAGRRASDGFRPPLSEVVLLRTPNAYDGARGGTQHPDKRLAGGHQPSLADQVEHLLRTPDATHGRKTTRTGPLLAGAVELLPTVADSRGTRNATSGRKEGSEHHDGWTLGDVARADRWGDFGPAIARWEAVMGRPAPDPTEPGRKGGKPRLAVRFVEWLMGYPDGYLTDLVVRDTDPRPLRPFRISRNQALARAGNGIVALQGAHAIHLCLDLLALARIGVPA